MEDGTAPSDADDGLDAERAARVLPRLRELTDLGLMTNLLPGYMTLPNEKEQDFEGYIALRASKPLRPNQLSYWSNYRKFHVSFMKTWWGDAAKAMSRKLRPTDSIYRLSSDLFALVLPETDPANAQRVALRLQEELQAVRAKFGGNYDISCYNYPEQVQSAHELEDIVRSRLPEEPGWDVPVPLATL